MKPKLKPFKAWVVCVGEEAGWSISRDRRECVGYIECGVHMGISGEIVRSVVVRSSEDDAAREAEIRRLRRALAVARNKMIVGKYGDACSVIARATKRKGGAK